MDKRLENTVMPAAKSLHAFSIHRILILSVLLITCIGSTGQALGSQGLSRDGIFQVQFHLNQLGFSTGRPDGVTGPATRSAVDAYERSEGREFGLSQELLNQLRQATAGIEGYRQTDGSIALLVFTDEDTPLILSVLNYGQIFKTPSRSYVREYDRDGTPIKSNRFSVSHIGPADEIPYEPKVSFGYQVRVPAPPRGERLQIDHVVQWPLKQSDGSTRYEDNYVSDHVYLKKPNFNPRYWTWQMGETVNADQIAYYSGVWKIELRNRGKTLMVRDFIVGRKVNSTEPDAAAPLVSWRAASTTASAITGDIGLNETTLALADGKRLPLSYIRSSTAMWFPFQTLEGRIYRVSDSGSQLCDGRPVTYIVLSRPQDGILALTPFSATQEPQGFDGNCGVYNYER